eukprot:361390-Chlamydomonas_euryale.AAC.5
MERCTGLLWSLWGEERCEQEGHTSRRRVLQKPTILHESYICPTTHTCMLHHHLTPPPSLPQGLYFEKAYTMARMMQSAWVVLMALAFVAAPYVQANGDTVSRVTGVRLKLPYELSVCCYIPYCPPTLMNAPHCLDCSCLAESCRPASHFAWDAWHAAQTSIVTTAMSAIQKLPAANA